MGPQNRSPSPAVQRPLGAQAAREVLRRLRDLDLRSAPIAVSRGLRVSVAGCLSRDAPMGHSLHYRLRQGDGEERELELDWAAGSLSMTLSDADHHALCERSIALFTDPDGRAFAPEIAARMRPESSDRREVEHFLRRIVRAAFASASTREAG